MTGAERVGAAAAGVTADRRAVAPVLSLYGARLTGCPLDRYYRDARAYADGQAEVRRAFGPDVLFAPFAFALLGEAFGGALKEFPDQAPNLRRPAADALAEWGRVALPDPGAHPRLSYLLEATRLLRSDHGGEVCVAAPLPSPVDLPALALGAGPWLEALLFEPEAASRLLESLRPYYLSLAEAYFEAGASFLVLSCAFASPTVVTREVASRLAVPALAETLSGLAGPAVLHHGGGPSLRHLDLLAGVPGVLGFALDEADDLGAARAAAGPGALLAGGVSGPALAALEAPEVEARCRRMLEARRGDPRFLLYTSGPDVPWSTPPENVAALRRAAEAPR